VHILIGGALCGLGGAYLTLVYVPAWQDNITAGRGWIAVALVIFATWNPYKAIIGSYFFGALSLAGIYLQKFNIHISLFLIDMLPYIVTIIVLVFISMRKVSHSGANRSVYPYVSLGTLAEKKSFPVKIMPVPYYNLPVAVVILLYYYSPVLSVDVLVQGKHNYNRKENQCT
jgi:hypothetical protein